MSEVIYWPELKEREPISNRKLRTGDTVSINPFYDLPCIFCKFIEYVTEDYVIVEVPPLSDRSAHLPPRRRESSLTWFRESAGNYIFPAKYMEWV